MTVCIAAICMHEGSPAIILCSDWRAESGDVAGGDVEDKLAWIVPKSWVALKAGVVADADRMLAAYHYSFTHHPISQLGLVPAFIAAFQQYRLTLINDYLIATLGIQYTDLLGGVKTNQDPASPLTQLPESYIEKKLVDVENVPFPSCHLIIAGYAANSIPVLCVVNDWTDPKQSWAGNRFESNFCAIGSGAAAALTVLYRREHIAPEVHLMQGIYNVFEAKLAGEVSPGVGDATSITILFPDGKCWDLSSKGHRYMLERYNYFGPMKVGRKRPNLKAPFFAFSQDFFEDYKPPVWNKWENSQSPNNDTKSVTDQT